MVYFIYDWSIDEFVEATFSEWNRFLFWLSDTVVFYDVVESDLGKAAIFHYIINDSCYAFSYKPIK